MKTSAVSRWECLSRRLTLALLLLSVLTFIFANSLTPGAASSQASGGIYAFLSRFFGFLPFFSHHFVRKAAHFCEYAVLGFLCALTPSVYLNGRKGAYPLASLFSLAVAATDELVQTGIAGRVGSGEDVFIDALGALFGFLLPILTFGLKRITCK